MEKKYKIKVPDTVHQMTKVYHVVGLWKTGNGNVSLPQVIYFTIILAFLLSSFIGACTCDDRDNAVFLAALVIILTVQACRLRFIICKQNQIIDLMHTVSGNSTDDHQAFCVANNKIHKLLTLAKAFLAALYSLCVVVICLPLINKQLLFDIAFPLDYKTNEIAFWMSYAFVVATYVLSVTLLMFIIMLWYMMMMFVVKYDFVASEFRNLGAERKKITRKKTARRARRNKTPLSKCSTNAKPEGNSYVNNFVESIKGLNTINGQLDKFESFFSSLFLTQIITSSICICGMTFVLAFNIFCQRTRNNFIYDGFYFIEAFYCFADIYAVLYLANEIMLSSGRLGYSLFESIWIDQTQFCKKYIIVVVEYLKQPRQIVVGKLFPMNLDTFIVIVQRAYTMFNILRNFQQ